MKVSNVYLKPIHPYAYRRDETPIIDGIFMIKPSEELEERLCYRTRYLSDNKVDYIPISETKNGNYEVIS